MRCRQTVKRLKDYVPPRNRQGYIRLDMNENLEGPSPKVIQALTNMKCDALSSYPEYKYFLRKLSKYVGDRCVKVSNGADDAIKSILETYLEEEMVLAVPTFDMFAFYAGVMGAKVKEVEYEDDLSFPSEKIMAAISERTSIVVLVSPNNPTGNAIDEKEIRAICQKAASLDVLVLLDEAYAEFCDRDYLKILDEYDNLVIIRTFSKAFGLAGLRLGYIIANQEIIKTVEKASSPYNVSSVSIAACETALDDTLYVKNFCEEVRNNREALKTELESRGFKVYPSQANFLLVRFDDKNDRICWELRERGILVRNRSSSPKLQGCTRISIGTEEQCRMLLKALDDIMKPVLLFDMDGVLADVRRSYRKVIEQTAKSFLGSEIDRRMIQELKEEGGFNNDWMLCREILRRQGLDVGLDEVRDRFQRFYLRYRDDETLIPQRSLLDKLRRNYRMGIVTGRPREEAEYFLKEQGIENLFDVLVTNEDVENGKPSPDGLNLALEKMGAVEAYYFGDAVDDMIAARKAGIKAVGVLAPDAGDTLRARLVETGAIKVLNDTNDITEAIK